MEKELFDYASAKVDEMLAAPSASEATKQAAQAWKDAVAVEGADVEAATDVLLDAISARDSKKALMLLHRQLADGTYFTVLLALLTRHVRQLWQAKVLMAKGVRGRALAKPLELNPFIAEKLGRAAASFKEPVLKRAMLLLIDADYLLKTGQAGNELLEEAVITLCKN